MTTCCFFLCSWVLLSPSSAHFSFLSLPISSVRPAGVCRAPALCTRHALHSVRAALCDQPLRDRLHTFHATYQSAKLGNSWTPLPTWSLTIPELCLNSYLLMWCRCTYVLVPRRHHQVMLLNWAEAVVVPSQVRQTLKWRGLVNIPSLDFSWFIFIANILNAIVKSNSSTETWRRREVACYLYHTISRKITQLQA